MKRTKVLHLASFDGNIGDNANHNGMRYFWKNKLPIEFEITELEIREFHWKRRKFDNSFVSLCNQHDLLIIGGGNYFELWVENSRTGTTVDLPPALLQKIEPPIFFNGLGCDPYKGFSDTSLGKFSRFLDFVLSSDRYFLTVRNDGSKENIKRLLGEVYSGKITVIPDGGFFVLPNGENFFPEFRNDCSNVLINLAGDMPEIRFPGELNYSGFVEEFVSFLTHLFGISRGMNFIFVPHIFRDYNIINDVLSGLNDEIRRRFVSVTPYLHGMGKEKHIFDFYRKADLTLGMRFHSNVCSIGLNTPSIALLTYPKIFDLCKGLGLEDRAVWVNEKGFSEQLIAKTLSSLEQKKDIKQRYATIKEGLVHDIEIVMGDISSWLERNRLI